MVSKKTIRRRTAVLAACQLVADLIGKEISAGGELTEDCINEMAEVTGETVDRAMVNTQLEKIVRVLYMRKKRIVEAQAERRSVREGY